MSTERSSSLPDRTAEQQQEFYQKVASFPEIARELVSDISSMLMEPDVAARFRADTNQHSVMFEWLKASGLDEKQTQEVLEFFGVPQDKKEEK